MPDELSGADRGSTPPSFDFDDDAIASLLDSFVETQTGPQMKHVSRPPDPDDVGAQAAQRTVFQHVSRHEALPLVGDDAEARARRIALLDALSARAVGSTRARLLTSAAELGEQLGDVEGAARRYADAAAADARDVVVLRALRRHAIRSENWSAAAAALEKESGLELTSAERAAALKLLAQIQLIQLKDAAAAEQAATHAAELEEDGFVAWMLVAAARGTRGEQCAAARALTNAAQGWPSLDAQAVILSEAARLMERGGALNEAKALFERVLELHPGSLGASLGIARTARELGEPRTAIEILRRAAEQAVAPVAGAVRRVAAVIARNHGWLDDARTLVDGSNDAASVWTRAEIEMASGAAGEAAEVLARGSVDQTLEQEGVDVARRTRLRAELGEWTPDPPAVHPALESYVRSLRGLQTPDSHGRAPSEPIQGALSDLSDTSAGRIIAADRAARLGQRVELLDALERACESADATRAEGAALAFAEATQAAHRADALLLAEKRCPGGAYIRRALALADDDATRAASRWRDEGRTLTGARGAFAFTMAARLMHDTEPAYQACEAALQVQPSYPPALWCLEEAADTDERRSEAALRQAEVEPERARAHRLRASMTARSGRERMRYAEAALEGSAPDPLLLEHLVEAAGPMTQAAGDLMALAARTLGFPGYLERAAAAYRAAGLAPEAARALRAASSEFPDNVAIRVRRKDAELQASEFARLADSAMRQAREAFGEEQELRALAAMAEVDRLARRDMQSARLSLQSIAELRPDHIPTARALEWDALRERDTERIRSSAQRLLTALPEGSADRLARHRLVVELLKADSDVRQSDVDRLLRSFDDDLGADPGLARQVLGAAYEKGETELGVRALVALQASVGDELERAAFALEASQLWQHGGDTGRALEALNTAGNHPLALEAEARLLRAAKRWEDAAAAHQDAARRAKDSQRAASLWRESACIFEEELLDGDRALEAWVAAAGCDIRYLDVYRRLAAAYQEAGRLDDLARLIDARIDAGADTPTLVGLLLEKAEQRRAADDIPGVVDALHECLELDPHHFRALRELVSTHLEREDWQSAAEGLIRIARLKRSPHEQVWAFSLLAEIYHEHLGDLPRAEAALRKAHALAPTHIETLDRLASVLSERDNAGEAARILHELVGRASGAEDARDYRIRLAEAVERAGDPRQSEAMLEQLRVEQPTEPDVIFAVADYYARQGAGPAEAMHLNRAANDLREAIETQPGIEALWTTLVRVLNRRHGVGAASCAASAAIAIGHPASLFEGDVGSDHGALGEPKVPLSAAVDNLVAPSSLPHTVRRLFTLCEHAFDKMLPFDASAWRLRRPSGPHRILVEEAGNVAEALGISEPRLKVTYIAPASCMPISGDPPTLVVGGSLHEMTSPRERVFLFARALKVASNHLAPALRARPEELDAALLALLQGHDPSRAQGAEPHSLDELRRKLLKAVPRRWRDEVESLVLELRGNSAFSTRLVPFAVSGLGDRTALTLTGDVPAAVDGLLKVAGRQAPATHAERLDAIRETPEAWALIRFAISDAHFEARTLAGVDP